MNRPNISHVWKYNSSRNFEYPENDKAYADFFKGKENFGICFSGGGTRSATCTVGQLHGLNMIGVLERTKYIASNSGGTWGSLPYIYFKGDLNKYFGKYYSPEKLTAENITKIPKNSFLYNMTKSGIVFKTLFDRLGKKNGDESFSQGIARIFLKPHHIDYKNKYFTLNNTSFTSLQNNNSEIKSEDFIAVTPHRPFHIASGTLHNWKYLKLSRKKYKRLYHVEMTPLYAGIKVLHKNRGDKKTDIGGGFVDPFAFDSIFEKKISKGNPSLIMVKPPNSKNISHENQFTLADVMGISGSALTSGDISVDRAIKKEMGLIKFIKKLSIKRKGIVSNKLKYIKYISYILNSLPEVHHFSPHNIDEKNLKTIEYNVGDGGPVDDIALMPLLARNVPKILCFCNVQSKIIKEKSDKSFTFNENNFDKDILCLFGLQKKKGKIKPIKSGGFQQVFEIKDFSKLAEGFKKAIKEDKPLIYEGIHKVLPNVHFGIKGGYNVHIMWFYNERCKSWEEKIDKDISDKIAKKGFGKRLKNFPNFKTFGENGFRIIDMHPEQVMLLSNYQTWIIKENKEKILKFL